MNLGRDLARRFLSRISRIDPSRIPRWKSRSQQRKSGKSRKQRRDRAFWRKVNAGEIWNAKATNSLVPRLDNATRLYSCVSRNANIAWQEYFSTSTTCCRHVCDRRADTIVVMTNEHGGTRTRVDLGEKGEKWEKNHHLIDTSQRSRCRSIQL